MKTDDISVSADYKDVFKKACLLQFSTSIWQCSRQIDQSLMQKIGENAEWLRGRKYLINPELLGPVRTAVHQSRNTIQKFALPFPITSVNLIPKDTLKVVDERLKYYKERFWNNIDEFEKTYIPAIEQAREYLGELFNEADYPADIKKKFNFEWRYLALSVPSKTTILSPEIYEREKQKFQELMDETRDLAIEALRKEMLELVTHLNAKLNGDMNNKVLKGSMFNKLKEFLNEIETRNIFMDDKLTELAGQARNILEGVSPIGFGYNTALRNKVKSQLTDLKSVIDASLEDLPRRMIHLPKDFQPAEEN